MESLHARRTYYTDQLNLAITGKQTRIPLSVIEEQLSQIEEELSRAQALLAELNKHRSARMVEEETLAQLAQILPRWTTAFRQALAHQQKFLLNQVIERVNVYDDTMEVTVNVRIKEIIDAAKTTADEIASTFEGAIPRGSQSVHQRRDRGPATDEDAQSTDELQELFRFELKTSLEQERRLIESNTYWARVREVEEETGRPFGELVHELRLKVKPAEIPRRLGVSRHFLYHHFGWAMDKVAWVERQYGKPLGQVVAQRRAEGVSMERMAEEWGLAVTTLYGALRRESLGRPL